MTIGHRAVELDVTLPAGSIATTQLLPIFQTLTNLVVNAAEESVSRQGRSVSCSKGCGACCRQPVPISETEARAISRLVDAMPEPRRMSIRTRFSDARSRLDAAGMLGRYRNPERLTSVELMSLARDYFALGIACPFLEDESCSIHADRPLACREYLVTSPAENCANPAGCTIEPVPLALRVAAAVRAVDQNGRDDRSGWVLLSLALEWATKYPESEQRPAEELLQEYFDRLSPRTDWVFDANLRPFLTAIGWALGAEFGPGDWLAVKNGLRETDESIDRWFEFTFATSLAAHLYLARGQGGIVRFRSSLPKELESQLRLTAALCQRFTLSSTD